MSIRWLSNTRMSMQRLGFCKAVLLFYEHVRTSNEMANLLREKLEERAFSVPRDQVPERYLNALGESRNSTQNVSITLQRLYCYRHPSGTGWLSQLAFREYVEYLPGRLGLVTESYKPSVMGLLLSQCLMSLEQRRAFDVPSSLNPLVLERGEQMFFLYKLLEADGDFLLPFIGSLLRVFGGISFDFLGAGGLIPDVIGSIMDRFDLSVYTKHDREQFRALGKRRERISGEIEDDKHKEGSGASREQTTIPRMEWLADIGIVDRVRSREWKLTDVGQRLKEMTEDYRLYKGYPENAVRHLLDSAFFDRIARAYGGNSFDEVSDDRFLGFVWPAYEKLAGLGGYCPLRPLVLYANALNIISGSRLFLEYETAASYLESAFQSDPTLLHYTTDRFNTDYQVTISRIP